MPPEEIETESNVEISNVEVQTAPPEVVAEPVIEPIQELPKTEETTTAEQLAIETPTPEVPPAPPEQIPEPTPTTPIIETPPVVEITAPILPEPLPQPTRAGSNAESAKPESPITNPLPRSSSEELAAVDPSIITDSIPSIAPTLPIVSTPPVAPAVHDPKYTKGMPQKVLELTPEEINAARLLWARENIAGAREQSYLNRREHMNLMNAGVETIVKANPQTTTREVAREMHISEKSASGYLYRLVKAGRIKSSGNSHNKRYFG